ncbi:sugar ABC transporter substrate-binding protein [Salinarchaeum sp. Harcht-Bsk1]|uniref:ABC transporter substrate-binding protein n=1 Tax=Salinarchaeum sp. Harcht-Bsk1 TaxID=1333523 RepID=UPI0003423669|nr:ABC transporter substrate-binding protein [Salinarchaeum sp. Harcht-Bsk1]AGN02752.1 sugar ABC transporter substrate-binding protein [Salinarchaeum sp. Harcht-Bsk1]
MTNSTESGLGRREYMRGAAAAGAAGTTLFAGCLTGDDGGGDGVEGVPDEPAEDETFEIVHWWTAGGEEEALNALIDSYTEAYGYSGSDINNNPAPGGAGSAIDTAIQTRVIDEDPPSTFQIWPGGSLTPYTDADALNAINDVWTDEMESSYLDGVIDTAQDGDDFVAVPLNIHRLNQVFYNVEVAEDVGVDLGGLSSPEDLLDAMASADEAGYIGMAQQTGSVWSTLQLWEMVFLGQHGADTYRDVLDGNVGDYESQIQESLQLIVDYREYFTPNASSVTWDEANQDVISGDALLIHQGDWAAGQYAAAEGFDYGSGWDYATVPGTSDVYSIVMDSFVMPDPNPSPTMTKQWLRHCGSVEGQIAFNTRKGSIPPRTDVSMDEFPPFLQDQSSDFGDSSEQIPTIAHGSGTDPDSKSTFEQIFSGFLENWNASETAGQIVDQI